MSHAAENISMTHPKSGEYGFLARLRDGIRRRRVYNQTIRELRELSTRELDDLGISRSMISRLAYQAAYER